MKASRGAVLIVAALATALGCLDADRLIAVGRDGGGARRGGFRLATPVPVAGLRDDTDDIQDPALTGDELEIYFVSPTGGVNDIWSSRRTSATGAWGPSALVTELASTGNDEDPDLSDDGLTIHFASDRAGDGVRLYVSRARRATSRGCCPNRRVIWDSRCRIARPAWMPRNCRWCSGRSGERRRCRNSTARPAPIQGAAWQDIVELTAINSAWQDLDPALYAAGRALIFASRRTGQGRTADLYRTARADERAPFDVTPVAIDELNTADSSEGDPWLSEDGRHILFASDRSGRNRIYEARR